MTQRLLVKVQRSRYTTAPREQMLIYDWAQKYMYEGPLTEEIRQLLCRNGDPRKGFFYAHLEGTEIVLDEPAPWQEW